MEPRCNIIESRTNIDNDRDFKILYEDSDEGEVLI